MICNRKDQYVDEVTVAIYIQNGPVRSMGWRARERTSTSVVWRAVEQTRIYIYVGGPAGNITQTRIQHR